MKRNKSEPVERQLETIYWSEIHESHKKRKANPLMLDPEGRREIVDCILKDESPRLGSAYKKRQVIFDEQFVLYRILKTLSDLEYYEVTYLLKKLAGKIKGEDSIPRILDELCQPPDVADTSIPPSPTSNPKEPPKKSLGASREEVVTTDVSDAAFTPSLDDSSVPVETVDTEQIAIETTPKSPEEKINIVKEKKQKNA